MSYIVQQDRPELSQRAVLEGLLVLKEHAYENSRTQRSLYYNKTVSGFNVMVELSRKSREGFQKQTIEKTKMITQQQM